MWKKIFNKIKTPEGLGTIGSGAFFGWIGSISGLVSPKVFAFLGFAFTGINALVPFAFFGGLLGFLGIKSFKYWLLQREIKRRKEKYKLKRLLKLYYNFGFLGHFFIIFMTVIIIVWWSSICFKFNISTFFELIVFFPLLGLIIFDVCCIIAKIFKPTFEVK